MNKPQTLSPGTARRISSGALRADGLLLLTAIIWGFAFSAQRSGMSYIGPFAYTGIRFALGALSMLPLLVWSRRRQRATAAGGVTGSANNGTAAPRSESLPFAKKILWTGAAGLILFAGSTLQQVGIISTTAGNAGFITCLYVVIVPLTGTLFGKRSSLQVWIGAALALIGLYILSIGAGFVMASGDVLVLIGAFFWAFHILVVARLANRMDALELAFGQYLVCSVLSLIIAVVAEPAPFAGIADAAIPILYGGIMSIGVAFTLQIVAQKTAHPTHASIILSMESLFAAVGGVLLLGESVTLRLVFGGAFMLGGMLVSQKTGPEK